MNGIFADFHPQVAGNGIYDAVTVNPPYMPAGRVNKMKMNILRLPGMNLIARLMICRSLLTACPDRRTGLDGSSAFKTARNYGNDAQMEAGAKTNSVCSSAC